MLNSIFFHFIFICIIVIFFVYTLLNKKKLEEINKLLIPILLKSKLQFPQNRSLVIRSLFYFERALSTKLSCDIKLMVDKTNLSKSDSENFLIPLYYFLWPDDGDKPKFFIIDHHSYSCAEAKLHIISLKNKKKIIFHYNFARAIWNITIV